MIQLNENNGNGNASVVFLFLFIWCGGAFFNNVLHRNAMSVFMPFSSVFNVFCAVIFRRVIFVCWLCSCSCDFVSFVKIFNMRLQGVLGIFQQRFVQKCNVGVYAVFINFQCFVCAVIFHRVIFVCWLCSCSCDFVSFVKIFNMQLQGVLGIFQQRFVQKCNVGVSLQFSSVFSVLFVQ